jgi:hypothetical protein
MMKAYTFRLKYDGGFHTIRTVAQSLDAAVEIVCTAENCPEVAIVGIWIKPINN